MMSWIFSNIVQNIEFDVLSKTSAKNWPEATPLSWSAAAPMMTCCQLWLTLQHEYDVPMIPQIWNILYQLGPGRPSAGGPRMDRRAVTSPGVVKVSRLASHLPRSARRGPQIPRNWQAARNVPLIKKTLRHWQECPSDWKSVMSMTGCRECPSD